MNTEETAMRPAPDPVPSAAPLDRAAAAAEIEQARQDFHRLLHHATAADLCRPTAPRVPLLAGQIRGRRAGRCHPRAYRSLGAFSLDSVHHLL